MKGYTDLQHDSCKESWKVAHIKREQKKIKLGKLQYVCVMATNVVFKANIPFAELGCYYQKSLLLPQQVCYGVSVFQSWIFPTYPGLKLILTCQY